MTQEKLKALLAELPTDQLQEIAGHIEQLIEDRTNPDPAGEAEARAGAFDRRHQRFDCKFQATFIRHGAPPDGKTGKLSVHQGIVHDISQGGLCLRTKTALEVGEHLTVFLKSESWVEKRIFVEVRRCVPRGDFFDVGAMFVSQETVIAAERQRLQAGGAS